MKLNYKSLRKGVILPIWTRVSGDQNEVVISKVRRGVWWPVAGHIQENILLLVRRKISSK